MIVLEILMVLVGLGAVVYSFRLVEEKKEPEPEQKESIPVEPRIEEPPIAWEEKLSELREKVEYLYDEVDDRMSRLSNEKIMGMSEYSDQVLDKIEKNHGEVVFLYDMMNAKQEEIQKLIREIDGMKADLHDEAAGEFLKLKEQEKLLEEIRKEIELDSLEYQSQKEEIREEWEALERRVMEDDAIVIERESIENMLDTRMTYQEQDKEQTSVTVDSQKETEPEKEDTTSMFDAEIARIEEQETKAMLDRESEEKPSSLYQPLSEQEKPVNHNDDIIALHKKGRSVLDISKMLGLGQGEVKFVIDLYNAR